MVRMLFSLMLSLSFAVGAFAEGATLTQSQLNLIISTAASAKGSAVSHVDLKVGDNTVSYTITKDALGNITATGPRDADVQTVAIATGASGNSASVPLAVTFIGKHGAISSFNVTANANGEITGMTSTADTIGKVKSGPTLDNGNVTKSKTVTVTEANGDTIVETFTRTFGDAAGGGGTVSVTYAPGTSPGSSSSVSPH